MKLAAGLSFTAQMIGAAVMACLLLSFYLSYRKTYLLHWTLSWAALTMVHLAVAISGTNAIGAGLAAAHPARLIPAAIAMAGSYLYVGWVLFGVYEFTRRRPVRIVESRRILIGLAVFGSLTALLFVTADSSPLARHFARNGTFAIIGAAGFATAAVVLWRVRRRHSGVGSIILSIAFAATALQQLEHAFIGSFWLSGRGMELLAAHSGFIDLLIQTLVGVGMIACLLEDEREAAELAAVEIEHLAYHDALTGLPNRPLFMDRLIISLAQANRGNQKLAVFFLDLDRFKDINDSLGHSMGDALLKSVAERIRRCVREGDTVARFGGDEFTLLIPRIENIEDAAKIAHKIIETLKIPFVIHDQELFVTTSIGVSLFPGDGLDPETLVRNADTAMYRAKDQGRDNYQLYAPAMNARAVERLAKENSLRKALSQNELVLYYQPQIDSRTNATIGVEALIRWQHPEEGLLSPARFISVAEVSGLIVPIGEWVIYTACRQIKIWQKKIDKELTVAVNLSARQFQQPDLVSQIRNVVMETGIDPSSLEVEITESNAMQNAENTMYTLRELKALGIRISMDDFGTGYSSLNYLKRFPIDTLKLDQIFVRDVTTDPTDAAIVSAVISMAHSLNLKVVAEGVETEEQLDFLRRQHCDVIQGYLFSPPLPANALESFLIERKAANA
ncbi:MAG TPA: EAL domain-containing protein [Thermoanaerobaculia bacterium]|nr:EAL domain-containing protein [Thermoanaerobaculia bacterium]